jgi:uncharacterized membrane protein
MRRLLVTASVALLLVACAGIDSRVRVEVIDEAGKPVPGAFVGVQRLDEPTPVGAPNPVDGEGRFERELVPGRYRVFALADGFEQEAAEIRVVGGVPLDVRLVLSAEP